MIKGSRDRQQVRGSVECVGGGQGDNGQAVWLMTGRVMGVEGVGVVRGQTGGTYTWSHVHRG